MHVQHTSNTRHSARGDDIKALLAATEKGYQHAVQHPEQAAVLFCEAVAAEYAATPLPEGVPSKELVQRSLETVGKVSGFRDGGGGGFAVHHKTPQHPGFPDILGALGFYGARAMGGVFGLAVGGGAADHKGAVTGTQSRGEHVAGWAARGGCWGGDSTRVCECERHDGAGRVLKREGLLHFHCCCVDVVFATTKTMHVFDDHRGFS